MFVRKVSESCSSSIVLVMHVIVVVAAAVFFVVLLLFVVVRTGIRRSTSGCHQESECWPSTPVPRQKSTVPLVSTLLPSCTVLL